MLLNVDRKMAKIKDNVLKFAKTSGHDEELGLATILQPAKLADRRDIDYM